MRRLSTIAIVFGAVIVLAGLVSLAARQHDGPLGLLPGGPLVAGPMVTQPVRDWSFAAREETVELQLRSQSISRTTWILVHEGAAFVPCSLGFPPGKSWYRFARRDGRAVLRIAGHRYPVDLERVESAVESAALGRVVAAKYGSGPPGDASVWYFRVTSTAR